MKLQNYIKKLSVRDKKYKETCYEMIKEDSSVNLYYMLYSGVVGLLLLTLLILLTPHIIKGWVATAEYYAIYPIFVIFFLGAFAAIKNKLVNYYAIQGMCILMTLILFAGFICISIFPYTDNPQVYISLYIMILPALFIMRPRITLLISLCMSALYIFLAYRYKPYNMASLDAFSVIAALMFSRVLTYFIFHVRIEDFLIRKEMFKIGITDTLTSLFNRQGCEHMCCEYMNSEDVKNGYAVMMLDLDNFKGINDTYGHKSGDMVLKKFGQKLTEIFNEKDIISRIGGDEFFILAKNVDNMQTMEKKAEEILNLCMEISEKAHISLGSSIGVVFVKQKTLTFDEIYIMADKLLYESKNNGKNRCAYKEI